MPRRRLTPPTLLSAAMESHHATILIPSSDRDQLRQTKTAFKYSPWVPRADIYEVDEADDIASSSRVGGGVEKRLVSAREAVDCSGRQFHLPRN